MVKLVSVLIQYYFGAVNTDMLRRGLMRDHFGEELTIENRLENFRKTTLYR